MQGSGLGSELVRRAMDVAKHEHITRIVATQTPDNQVMLHIFEKLGFKIQHEGEDKLATATIDL
jgi:RimJ/RimL family protein N-acetyltransferase